MSTSISTHHKTALLFGVHGPSGRSLLQALLKHRNYSRILLYCHKPLKLDYPKLEVRNMDFTKISEQSTLLKGDDLFVCPGLMYKEAVSEHPLRFDPRLALEVIKWGARSGLNQLFLLSVMGADKEALLPGLQLRGLLEETTKLQDYWAMHIFKPAITLPDSRAGKIAGPFGRFFNRLSGSQLNAFEPVEPDHLADFILTKAQQLEAGQFVYSATDIQSWHAGTQTLEQKH